jgi:hypothetical protein
VRVVLGEIGWEALPMWVNPEWPNTGNSTGWPKEPLPAVAYVGEN